VIVKAEARYQHVLALQAQVICYSVCPKVGFVRHDYGGFTFSNVGSREEDVRRHWMEAGFGQI
jgi:hypothetical protein